MTASPVLITTSVELLENLVKPTEFLIRSHLHASIVSKTIEHNIWNANDWYPTYSLFDLNACWSSEEIQYLKDITDLREDYYYKGLDSVIDLDVPIGSVNFSQRVELSPVSLVPEIEKIEMDVRQDLEPHAPYPVAYYDDKIKAKAYVLRVLYRRVQDFAAIARSLLSYTKKKNGTVSVYLPGDGCGLGAYVFSSYGIKVVSEEPSPIMRELQKDQDIRRLARESLSAVAPKSVMIKADGYAWNQVQSGVFRYDVAVDYYIMSHIKDYVTIDYQQIKPKWISFEHRIFDMPAYHTTIYAPNGSIKMSHPGMISYPLTISDRVMVQYPIVFKEVFCRYKTFKLYEGTKGELSYMEAYNTMRSFKYLNNEQTEDPVLHVVRNTEVQGFKASDTIWHTLVGKEITLPIARVVSSLLNNPERRSLGIPYEFTMTPFLGYEFQFLPPSGRLYDVEGKELTSEPVVPSDPLGTRFVKVKDKTVYRYLHGTKSSILVARFVKLDYSDMTFEQWLAHEEDYPMPYNGRAFMLDGILYSCDQLDTNRAMVLVRYDKPRFLKAVEYGDVDEIRAIVAGYAI